MTLRTQRMTLRTQRGATLLIALIMLVLLSLFAVSSLNTATTNLKVVGNMQQRAEAFNVAQQVIESVISSTTFISNPANAVPSPCGSANTACSDVTGDGIADYTTTLIPAPFCATVKPIKNSELVLTDTEDLGCSAGQAQQFGVAGAVSGDSLCAKTVWEVTARTQSASSGATVTITTGVGTRVSLDDASC